MEDMTDGSSTDGGGAHDRPRPAPGPAPAPDSPAADRPDAPATPAWQQPQLPPAHRLQPAGHDHPSRRWILGGGLAVLAGAGIGVGAEYLLNSRPAHVPPAPPAALVDAAAAEVTLIANLDATTGGAYAVRRAISQARADHVAHLAALRQLLATFGRRATGAGAAASGSSTLSPPSLGTPLTLAQLRAAESAAATAAARRAAALDAAAAALLASISACEATHAELFA